MLAAVADAASHIKNVERIIFLVQILLDLDTLLHGLEERLFVAFSLAMR